MRVLALGQPIGQSADAKLQWIIEALREIERASHEESGEGSSAVSGAAGTALPLVDSGSGSVGTSQRWAHEDHVHPEDPSLATEAWVTAAIAESTREILTAARTYYVRTDGSDSNDGLTNNAGGAFLTIQKAVDTVCETIEIGSYQVTIQVGSGTYTGQILLRPYLSKLLVKIVGDISTPSNVVVSTTSQTAFYAEGNTSWQISGFKIQTTTSGNALLATMGANIYFTALDFGAVAGSHISASRGGRVSGLGATTYTISGGGAYHINCTLGGYVDISSETVTLTGTPAFSVGFAVALISGLIYASGASFSGSATGTRYIAQTNSTISTNGGGANFFPGNAAGSADGTSVYA
jgi:hypothetical protein